MKTRPRITRVSRLLCMLLAEIVAVTYTTPPVRAQAPEPKQLTISILEGEGAINNITPAHGERSHRAGAGRKS